MKNEKKKTRKNVTQYSLKLDMEPRAAMIGNIRAKLTDHTAHLFHLVPLEDNKLQAGML